MSRLQELKWSRTEKKVARDAFDLAYERECAAIKEQASAMLASITDPSDIWRVHDFLDDRREAVDRRYDYRYSVLPLVFGHLLRDGWLNEEDLAGLRSDKLELVKRIAEL